MKKAQYYRSCKSRKETAKTAKDTATTVANNETTGKTVNPTPADEMVYHYTCKDNFLGILKDRKLKTTCSELVPPTKPEIRWRDSGNGFDFRDQGYKIHPVVWFTTDWNPRPQWHGLARSAEDKTEFRIGLKKTPAFKSWKEFADQYGADPAWRKYLEKKGRHTTWFVHEGVINLKKVEMTLHRKVNGKWVDLRLHPEALQADAKPGKNPIRLTDSIGTELTVVIPAKMCA